MGRFDIQTRSATGDGADRQAVESRSRRSGFGSGRGERRGQTTLDFAIGISIFLLALSFVFVFVPGMLEPFSGGTQADTPAANRVADDLTQRKLGSAGSPYVLDSECTVELFTSGVPSDCQYDGTELSERVGVVERTVVNVTIRGDLDDSGEDSILCWDSDASPPTLAETGSGDCDTVLSGGSKPSGSGGKTVTATRVALLDGHDVTVEVTLW